jgi:putative membrane protein
MSGSTGSSESAAGGGGSSAGTGSTTSGAPSAGQKLEKGLQSKLEKLHADNQGEIQLAQVAEQNAQSPEVKQFAQQMQTDHQRLDGKLQDTIQTMGASLEGKDFQKAQSDNQKDMQKLQSKTGADFDKDYMSRMVKDHEKDIKAVKDARKDAEKGHHTELAALLQTAETGMQGHLDHAKAVQKSLGKGGSHASSSTGATSGTGSSAADQTKPSTSSHAGSRGDTGGPTPGGADRGTPGTNPSGPNAGGGAAGTSSDSGQRQDQK